MSLVQRRRSKSRESKTTALGLVSGVESFWRNTIACSPPMRLASSRERSSRPVLRARSQCYVRRVECDDGAARRLANLAYQGSDGDLSPSVLPGGSPPLERPAEARAAATSSADGGAESTLAAQGGGGGGSSSVRPADGERRDTSNPLLPPLLVLPPTSFTHIPSAISTPSRYPVLGGPLARSQSARGRRHATLSPTKTHHSSPFSTVSSSQGSASAIDISMTSALASPSIGGAVADNRANGDVESVVGGKSYDAALFDILKVSPEDLAAQITLLDIPVFKAIAPEELTSIAWTTKDKLIKAPNLVALTRRFNQINMWVQTEILNTSTVKARGVIMSHFVKVMKKLFDLNNLHSTMAILAALQSAAIFRLAKSWMELGSKDRTNFKRVAQLFSEENNNQRLREHMTSLRLQPCIPHMGMYLTDLVYVDVAHPYSGGMESAPRRDAMNNIIRVIADYQASCNMAEKLGPVKPHIQAYLGSFRYIEELQKFIEDDNFRLSKRLEPPPSASSASSHDSPSLHSPVQVSSPLSKKGAHHHHHHHLGKTAFSTPENLKCHHGDQTHRKTQSLSGEEFNATQTTAGRAASDPADPTVDPSKNLIDDSELDDKKSCQRTPSTGSGASGRLVSGCLSGADDRFSVKRFSTTSAASSLTASATHSCRKSFEESFEDEPDLYLQAVSGESSSGLDRQTVTMTTRSRDSFGDDDDDDVEQLQLHPEVYMSPVACEGCLKRKPLLKKGKKPTMQNFTRYWVQLSGSSLIYYAAKFTGVGTLGGSVAFERQAFKTDPCKMMSILGWMTILGDDPKEPDSFQLADPNHGNCYKFRAGTPARALTWCQNLSAAANGDKTRTPENLISLD